MFDKLKSLMQKGQSLVIAALMIPMIMACGAGVVDYGIWRAEKTRLQNAADAAAIAGAWHLDESDASMYSYVQDYVEKNALGNNITSTNRVYADTVPDSSEVLNVRMIPDLENKQLTVNIMAKNPTTFTKYFGFDSADVIVSATAEVTGSGGSFDDDMFKFGMVIAKPSYDELQTGDRNRNDSPTYFHTTDVKFTADMITNGRIYFDNERSTTLDGTLSYPKRLDTLGEDFFAGKNQYNPEGGYWDSYNHWVKKITHQSVWGMNEDTTVWDGAEKRSFSFIDADGNSFVNTVEIAEPEPATAENGWKNTLYLEEYSRPNDEGVEHVKYIDEEHPELPELIENGENYGVDISLDAHPSVKSWVENIANMSDAERKANYIYYGDNAGFVEYGGSDSVYPFICPENKQSVCARIIVCENDVIIKPGDLHTPGDDDFFIVISLHGNIDFTSTAGTVKGIFYAPEGKINVNFGNNCPVYGSLVAQELEITIKGEELINNDNIYHSIIDNLGTKKTVRLIK